MNLKNKNRMGINGIIYQCTKSYGLHIEERKILMERGLFYLPCHNNVDDMPPSFEGWYNPHQRWNGWYAPLFNEETFDKICA